VKPVSDQLVFCRHFGEFSFLTRSRSNQTGDRGGQQRVSALNVEISSRCARSLGRAAHRCLPGQGGSTMRLQDRAKPAGESAQRRQTGGNNIEAVVCAKYSANGQPTGQQPVAGNPPSNIDICEGRAAQGCYARHRLAKKSVYLRGSN